MTRWLWPALPGFQKPQGLRFHQQTGVKIMTQSTNKPTHTLVRFYGEGRNAPRGNIGVVWTGDDGRFTIVINSLEEQIRLMAFPIGQTEGDAQ
jgi:hypothetical protein